MKPDSVFAFRQLRLCCLGLAIGPLTAQISIGGNQSGTLAAGVYKTTASLTIAAGQTWTLSPGVIIKFTSPGHEVSVLGTLNVNGTAVNRVVFTDYADDTAGGDTNGDGPSVGKPTSWRGIVFSSTGGGTMNYADVRYGGANFVANVMLNGSSPTLNNCILRNNYVSGLDCSNNSKPTVTNCTFTGNGAYAIDSVSIGALAGFSGNTASGNSAGNYARVTNGTVSGKITVPPSAHINGAIVFDTSIVVPVGATLTIEAGTVLKMKNVGVEVQVNGTIAVNGSATNRAIFTGLADDSAGGDTNGDGSSVGAATSWRGIVFSSTGGGTMNYADVRYGGANFVANVLLNDSSPTLNNCILRNNFVSGMSCNGNAAPIVRNCVFVNNGAYAVDGLKLTSIPGFTNNSASGNANGNGLRVTDGTVSGVLTINPRSVMAGALVMSASLNVTATGVLTVQQGVHFKFQYQGLEVAVSGRMNLRGTGFEPVVFTDYRDDSVGGDTNNDGPSSGSPAGWRGVTYNANSPASSIENVIVRFTGANFVPAFSCANSLVDIRALRVDRAFDRGIVLSALSGTATNLIAWQCGNIGVHLTGGDFTVAHATATGNGTGMKREAAWTGAVVNSISRGNNTNFTNFVSSSVLSSNGAFPGVNRNIDLDPQFVDATKGDLRLMSSSPCLGAADILQALRTVKDIDENSRFLDHSLAGLPLPDMGAHERSVWDMTVGGTSQVGTTLKYTVTGPPGVSFYLLGPLDGFALAVPYGLLLVAAQASSVVVLSAAPTNTAFSIPIPNEPVLEGLALGIQSLTVSSSNAAVGGVTRMHRMLLRP